MSHGKLSKWRYNDSIQLFAGILPELLNEILEYLDNVTFVVLRFVSRAWKSIISDWGVGCNLTVWGAKYNSIEFIRWGMYVGHPCTIKSFKIAIENGSVEIVKFLFLKINSRTAEYCTMAVKYGHLEVLKYLDEQGFELDGFSANREAASNGHLDILKWLKTRDKYSLNITNVVAAAKGGHIEVLKWMHANNETSRNDSIFDIRVSRAAARGGHIVVLKWLSDKGVCQYDGTLTKAAGDGNPEVVVWLRTKEYTFTTSACDAAASRGDLDCLWWLHKNKCPWHSYTCTLAAGGGHIIVLQWLIKNGCPYNKYVATTAAYNGHLEIVQWLSVILSHEYYPNSPIYKAAIRGGHMAVTQWLITNDHEISQGKGSSIAVRWKDWQRKPPRQPQLAIKW